VTDFEYHVTDGLNFRSCRRRWEFGSKIRMNLEPDRPVLALWTGTALHYGMQLYYQPPGPPDALRMLDGVDKYIRGEINLIRNRVPDLNDEQDEGLRKNADLIMGMLEHYAMWAPSWDTPDNPECETGHPIIAEVLEVEHKFNVPLIVDNEEIPGIRIRGMMDGVIRDQNSFLWVLEHKSAAQFRERHHLLFDEQPGVYVYAAGIELGEPIRGVLYNLLRKKVPTVPEVLKYGGLTKRANIDSTYEVYLATIKNHGLNPADYEDILGILRDKGNKFFRRVEVERRPKQLSQLTYRIRQVAEDMQNGQIYASPEVMKCSMCPFEPVCIAIEDDADWKYILNSGYRTREEHPEPEDVIANIDAYDLALEAEDW